MHTYYIFLYSLIHWRHPLWSHNLVVLNWTAIISMGKQHCSMLISLLFGMYLGVEYLNQIVVWFHVLWGTFILLSLVVAQVSSPTCNVWVYLFPNIHTNIIVSFILDNRHPDWSEKNLSIVLNWIYKITEMLIFFIYLKIICMSSVKCLLFSLIHLFIELFIIVFGVILFL